MDAQAVANGLAALVAFFGGIYVNSLRAQVSDLYEKGTKLKDEVHFNHLAVVEHYAKKDGLKDAIQPIMDELHKITAKLDMKVDK